MKKNQNTFQFTDSKFQTSLIKKIEDAGIEYILSNDGSIIYSENLLETFINRIVDAEFPDGYYRVEIIDPAKAYRYRRFKKFTGTPLIEEIRNGSTFFIQKIFEKIYRYCGIPTHVSFVLSDENLGPDITTSILGIHPTFACCKGEPFNRPYKYRRKEAAPFPSRSGWWELCSIPNVESNDVCDHLNWLFDQINPVEIQLGNLARKSPNDDYRVLQISEVRSKGSMEGVSLSSSVLERLSVLCDRVDTWFHQDDFI